MNESPVIVKKLLKKYGEYIAVNEISFEIKKGQVFSLLGPNGAGKTTTVEILEGLRKRDGGEVSVLGLDPENSKEIYKKIGILPQDFTFVNNSTPKEAIEFYCKLFNRKLNPYELLDTVELRDRANVPFSKLSGGQKQKLGLALSLINDPEVLFLDEPTAGLDPKSRRNIWRIIENLKKEDRSILLTSHYLEEAELLADNVAIMNKGKIVDTGSPKELILRHRGKDLLYIKGGKYLEDVLEKIGAQFKNEDGYFILGLNDSKEAIEILNKIDEMGVPFDDFMIRRENLEDIFLKVTEE
ncbi:MAG: ABC transporter ATP-binding protein [Thermoplasmatales archaeon]|jgi:ABC-2 type transport system ATP-binding protein